jgi:hypothetical protein
MLYFCFQNFAAMFELFSFLNNPFLVLLQESIQALPGIDRIDVIFFERERNKTVLYSAQQANQENTFVELPIESQKMDGINSFRRKQKEFIWLNCNDLPYSNNTTTSLIPTIFSETESHILVLSFPNETDFSKDLFFFYFKKNAAEFGMNKSENLLTTSNKVIIAKLLYSNLTTRLHSIQNDQRSLVLLNAHFQAVAESKIQFETENRQLAQRNKENIIQLTEFLLNDLTNGNREVYILADDAKELIGLFTGSIFDLKNVLNKAMIVARTLQFDKNRNEYTLKADYFSFANTSKKNEESVQSIKFLEENVRHSQSKTFDFLNEMEEAAQKALHLGWKLTSTNIGHLMEKPITAAAISDKLKHHAQKINKLMEQYPAKWSVTRNRFRPLQNCITKAERKPLEKAG